MTPIRSTVSGAMLLLVCLLTACTAAHNSTPTLDVAALQGDARRAQYEIDKKMLWLTAKQHDDRMAGVGRLPDYTEWHDETRAAIRLALPFDPNAGVVEAVTSIAVEYGWTDITPGLIKRWVRSGGQPDLERIEPTSIQRLHPGATVPGVLLAAFQAPSSNDGLKDSDRFAAWEIMMRLEGDDSVRTTVRAWAGDSDPIVSAVALAQRDLGVLPATREQFAWLLRLREDHTDAWNAGRLRIAQLTAEQREGLELRHLSAVFAADAPRLATPRDELLDSLASRLDRRDRADRSGPSSGQSETLHNNKRDLVWADLLTAHLALDAIDRRTVADSLFAIADDDFADRSTEYGGAITWTDAGPAVQDYPPHPTERINDRRFVASRDMISNSDLALLHFHLHAQKHKNARFAGPSTTDIAAASRLGRSSLVLTFLDENTLNVDFFQPNGAVLDLGTIVRSGF